MKQAEANQTPDSLGALKNVYGLHKREPIRIGSRITSIGME